jgi:alkanesulfonate monooxygenase SsuD/methylene tetrahydromethanopterin reductase-like flavin-dependent oxidoreductase (luciferase family)
MASLRFGWHVPSFPVDGSSGKQFVEQIVSTLHRVQDRFDSIWVDDHFVPWAKWQSVDTPYIECVTTMAYLAGMFPKLKIGASVLCQSYRNPALVAKMGANLQLFTGGRYIFGVGAGWAEDEYAQYNYEFPRPAVRIAQLEEAVQITRLLWTQTPATFEGKYYSIHEAYCEPKPDPVPPILIGGGGEQLTLRVVAKYADMWNIPGGDFENYKRKLGILREHCAAIGRDFDSITKTWSCEAVAVAPTEAEAKRIGETTPYRNHPIVGTPEQVADSLQRFVDIGVEYIIVRVADWPQQEGIDLFTNEVIPRLQAR